MKMDPQNDSWTPRNVADANGVASRLEMPNDMKILGESRIDVGRDQKSDGAGPPKPILPLNPSASHSDLLHTPASELVSTGSPSESNSPAQDVAMPTDHSLLNPPLRNGTQLPAEPRSAVSMQTDVTERDAEGEEEDEDMDVGETHGDDENEDMDQDAEGDDEEDADGDAEVQAGVSNEKHQTQTQNRNPTAVLPDPSLYARRSERAVEAAASGPSYAESSTSSGERRGIEQDEDDLTPDEEDDDEEGGEVGEDEYEEETDSRNRKAKPKPLKSSNPPISTAGSGRSTPQIFKSKVVRADSDDDDFSRKSNRKFNPTLAGVKRKSRAGSEASSDGPVRFGSSSRISGRGAPISYVEPTEDYGLISEGDDEAGAAGGYYDAANGLAPAEEIEGVFGHARDETSLEDKEDLPYDNIRFHIKWRGYSHLHNTDELYTFMKSEGYRGFKRVDNYIRQTFLPQQNFLHPGPDDFKPSREDLEAFQIELERRKDELENFKVVERIVAQGEEVRSEAEGGSGVKEVRFYCKWTGLPYSECTWEWDTALKGAEAEAQKADYRLRESRTTYPARSAVYPPGRRPEYHKITEVPKYLEEGGGTLKEFQLTGLNWLAYLWSKEQNGILADEMGLGKTVQSVAYLSYLFHDRQQYGPYLVVVPLSTISAWQMQFKKWAPDLNVICYMGSGPSRQAIRDWEFGPNKALKFNVLLTTYEFILKDRLDLGQIKWKALEVDEAHRLKNSDSQLYEALMSFNTASRLLITGTPLQNNVKELLALMHFLMPDTFHLANDFDLNDVDQESKIKDLHEKLETLMLRRLKKDVVKEMPTKSESILRVELSKMQTDYYKNILSRNFGALSKGGTQQVSLMNVAMELKKASNHPYLFDGAEIRSSAKEEILKGLVMNSGKMVLLDKLLARLKADGHRVLIFSQMVRLLDIMSDYMNIRGYIHQRLDGTVASDIRKKSIEHFNAPGSPDFAFLLSTRAGGLGINLETADTVIIFDSDYNPQNDLQAMARAHRIGQKSHVNIYRFVSKGTIEEDILERARRKMILEYAIINQMDTTGTNVGAKSGTSKPSEGFSKDELAQILKFGAQSMYKTDDNEQTEKLEKMDLDDILTKAENHDTEASAEAVGASLGGEGFLSQFAAIQDVKNDLDWEDIIPAEERAKVEQEAIALRHAEEQATMALQNKKRSAAPAPGAYEGMDVDDSLASGSKPVLKKPKSVPASTKKTTGEDKSMELRDKDIRGLVRGIAKWGDVRNRPEDVIAEGRLEGKNFELLCETAEQLIVECDKAVQDHKTLLKDKAIRGETITSAMRQKAILMTFKHVTSINAETTSYRFTSLRVLDQHLKRVREPLKWAVPAEHLKPTMNWTVEWSPFEDARLLVGIWRHGFSAWEAIMKDPELQMEGKFNLLDPKTAPADHPDAKKTPSAIHLVRRADYLTGLIREYEDNLKAYQEQQAREAAQAQAAALAKAQGFPSPSLSYAVAGPSRVQSSPAASASAPPQAATNGKGKRRATPVFTDSESEESDYASMDEAAVKEELRPVKKQLKQLKTGTETLGRDEKLSVLKDCLAAVGRRIDVVVEEKAVCGLDAEKWRKHLWVFASYFWPRQGVNYAKLQAIHQKMVQPAARPAAKPPQKRNKKLSAHPVASPNSTNLEPKPEQDVKPPMPKKIKLIHRSGLQPIAPLPTASAVAVVQGEDAKMEED